MKTFVTALALCLALALVVTLAGCASGRDSTRPASPEELFRRADTDGNGKVSREEFGDYMVAQLFSFYDRGNKGYVTMEDFVEGGGSPANFRIINRSGSGRITPAEAKASKLVRETMIVPFDEADLNKSGYVTLEEFIAYKKRAQPYIR